MTVWACSHATELGGAPGPVVVCGESAGGNLAAVTCSSRGPIRGCPSAIKYCCNRGRLHPLLPLDRSATFPVPSAARGPRLVLRDLLWQSARLERARVSPIFAGDLLGCLPRSSSPPSTTPCATKLSLTPSDYRRRALPLGTRATPAWCTASS